MNGCFNRSLESLLFCPLEGQVHFLLRGIPSDLYLGPQRFRGILDMELQGLDRFMVKFGKMEDSSCFNPFDYQGPYSGSSYDLNELGYQAQKVCTSMRSSNRTRLTPSIL